MAKKKFYKEDELLFADKPAHPRFEDIAGKTFGKLTVIGYAERISQRHYTWWCLCSCNSDRYLKISSLNMKSGNTKSCGCTRGVARRKTKEVFVKQSVEIHGDKYDYSKVKYTNNTTNVSIICPKHGTFNQQPKTHLQGGGCKKCCYEKTWINNKFHNKTLAERNKKEWQEKVSGIYLFHMEGLGFKIGISERPEDRLRELSTKSGRICTLYNYKEFSLYTSVYVEDFLHDLFSKYKTEIEDKFCGYTEIFNLEDMHVDFVCQFLAGVKEDWCE